MTHMSQKSLNTDETSRNPDPITGTPGSHPVGTGIGAAGAGLTGALIGSAAGPAGSAIGAAIGAVVGAMAGGLAGKGIAEAINPTDEDVYWSKAFKTRPYVAQNAIYDNFRPAYQFGWQAAMQRQGESFVTAEPFLRQDWEAAHPDQEWSAARDAVRDAYERATTERVIRPN